MHKINVLAFGSEKFNTSLEELKDHLNFRLTTFNDDFEKASFENYDVLFIHENSIKNNNVNKNFFKTLSKIKILAAKTHESYTDAFTNILILPFYINDEFQMVPCIEPALTFHHSSLALAVNPTLRL